MIVRCKCERRIRSRNTSFTRKTYSSILLKPLGLLPRLGLTVGARDEEEAGREENDLHGQRVICGNDDEL